MDIVRKTPTDIKVELELRDASIVAMQSLKRMRAPTLTVCYSFGKERLHSPRATKRPKHKVMALAVQVSLVACLVCCNWDSTAKPNVVH